MDESDARKKLLFKSRSEPGTETPSVMVSRSDQKIGDQRWFSLSNAHHNPRWARVRTKPAPSRTPIGGLMVLLDGRTDRELITHAPSRV